ncbi:MAG: hypothetical protein BWK76_15970 [Desulfobulbaceae bacterium A2]|nr:MAG: hypothetical protein BWK76_15970 [Desulfobulbaceae bacterium A2]
MPIFSFEKDDAVQGLLREGRTSKVDLPDILFASSARQSGCEEGITFDKRATKLAFFRMLR